MDDDNGPPPAPFCGRPQDAPAPVAYDIEGAAAAVSLSASYIRRQIHARRLRARLIDRKYRISHDDLKAWFDSLPEAS